MVFFIIMAGVLFASWLILLFMKPIEVGIVYATPDSIAERLRGVIAKHMGVEVSEIEEKNCFTQDFGLDSLDRVELIIKIEKEFKIEIPDQDAEKINTFDQAVDYLKDICV